MKKEIYINARFLTHKITGVERYAIEISKKLKRLIPEINFICPNRTLINKELGKELEVYKFGNFKSHLWEQVELPLYLRRKNTPLLINLINTGPIFYKNQLVTIHDLAFLRYPENFNFIFKKYYSFVIPKIAKKSRHIITVSKFSKNEIENLLYISGNKISIVNNAPSNFFSKNYNNSYNKYKDHVLAVSSIDPRKNFDRIIEAFNEIVDDDIPLVIVGNKNKVFSQKQIPPKFLQNNNIHFTGYVTDQELASLYKNAKVFVYTSLYEGFGIPPLEAMASGCPVIVSDIPSLQETCKNAAYYVNPYDANEIRKGIEKIFYDDSLRNDLIQKGYQNILRFSWDYSAKKIINIIDKLNDTNYEN